MANEFIARNGFRSQNNSDITGSLNVTAGITGSFTGSLTGIATTSSATNLTSTYVGYGNGSNLLTGTSNFVVNTTTGYLSAPLVVNVGGVPGGGYDIFNHFQMPYQITAFKSTTSGNPSEIQVYNNANALQFGIEGSTAGNRMGGTLAYNMYFGCYYNYGLTFHTNNAARGSISSAGNWFFGGNSAASAKVHIQGSGTTSATTSFLVQNSTPFTLFKITDDGRTEVTGSLGVTGGITGSLLGTATTSSVTILTSSYIGFGNGSNLMTGSSKFYYEDQTSYKRLYMLSPNGSSNYLYNYVDNSVTVFEGGNTLVVNSAYGELYLRSDYGTAINMYAGAGVSTFAARLERNNGLKLGGGGSYSTANAANYLTVDGGNSMFGTNSATSARVEIRGSGTTSATTTFLVRNSTPTTILEIKDNQSIGFFGVTPSTRPTTGITGAATGGGGGVPVDDATTYGGYTMGQVVAALKQLGLLT